MSAPLSALRLHLLTPTPVLDANPLGPPDEHGRRWRSHIREVLKQRGQGDLAGLRAFVAATGATFRMVAHVEAGRVAPPAWYRQRACAVLGLPEQEVFEQAAPPAPDRRAGQ